MQRSICQGGLTAVSVVADLTLPDVDPGGELKAFSACVRAVFDRIPPVFGSRAYGDKYRESAVNPEWFASSLVQNANVEADGSRKLWALAGEASTAELRAKISRHARDEARHARVYIALLDRTFPGALTGEDKGGLLDSFPQLNRLDDPEYQPGRSDFAVLDDIIQMNIGEIRTRINQLLLRPVISAYVDGDAKPVVARLVESVLVDETAHVRYTAIIIDEAIQAGHGDFVFTTLSKRLKEFNEITLDEVDGLVFEGF